MKHFVTLLLLLYVFPSALFAQTEEEVRRAMEEYDYEKVISLVTPECGDSLLLMAKARALKAMNRYPEAAGVLAALAAKDSTDAKTMIELAECYKWMGNSRQAARHYRKAVDLQPDNNYFRLQFIRSLLSAEDYEEARTACHGWLERDTLSATGYKYLGQAYEGLKDPASAFFSYNIAYRRDSLDAWTVARIAALFNDNNQFADAIDVTERYRQTDTTHIDVNRQNAKAYCMMKDYSKAVERYEALKSQGDRSFLTLYYLGVSHYGDNWFYGAYDNLKEAYEKNPTDVNVLYYLAKSAVRTSWKQEGVGYMEEALDIATPSDSVMARLYDGLADCYQRGLDLKKGIEALKKLYSYSRKNTILYTIARRYEWLKDEKNAILYYEKYMATVPENERYALDENGNPAEGRITYYQQAWKRIKEIKEEGFFREGVPTKRVPVERKDTLVSALTN